jgi:cytidylate kinase
MVCHNSRGEVEVLGPSNYEPLVTISATYGTGGGLIAPRLADELGVPFVDRLISADMSQDMSQQVPDLQAGQQTGTPSSSPGSGVERSQEGLTEYEQMTSPTGRLLSYFARAASIGVMIAPDAELEDDTAIRDRTEAGLKEFATGQPGVLLGRAGAVVLASRPRAFHVRLDAPVERRVAWAAGLEQLDLEATKRRQSETDRARTAFVKRLFRVDPGDPKLYHLVLDTTVIGIDRSVRVLATAARAFFEANPGD